MSFDQTEWVWMNGEMVRWNEATVHVSVHTLHLGSGVFEAMRCYETVDGPAVFRMDEHLERLGASAEMHQMKLPYTREELAEAVRETIKRNGLRVCYVRVLCFYGSGSLGVYPAKCPVEVAIITWPLGAYLGAEALKSGVRITVSPWVKFHSRMMPTTAKACGQYLNSTLALREAIGRGFDEALLLDVDNNIAEGTGENLFLVRQGRLYTNDERSSILLGITRDAVLHIARHNGYEVETGTLRVEDLLAADEAFFTGTAAEVTPIREVDGRPIGQHVPGPVTAAMQEDFFAATSGRHPEFKSWLHPVG